MVRSPMWLMSLCLLLGLGSANCASSKSQQSPESLAPKADITRPILNLKGAVTPIQSLMQAKNQTVQLEGTVGKQVPFLGSRAYELRDATGTVWVVTTNVVPATGTPITIQGVVRYQRITQDRQAVEELYVEEQAQLSALPLQSALPRR